MTRVIDFNANYGQHMAIMAAFERVRGDVIVTLDADLQNPPEEIPKLLEKIDAGHDYVGGYRLDRQDSFFRTHASQLINLVREKTTNIEMTDQGCMLRAYSRPVIDAIVRSGAINTFIPALAYSFASNPDRGRREARGAPRRRFELFVLHAGPAEFRPDHRLLARAAAVFHDVRHGLRRAAASLLVLVLAYRRFVHRTPTADGVFTLFGDPLLPAQRGDGRHRPDRRIRRPHLPGRPRPPAVFREGNPGDEGLTALTAERRRRRSGRASMRRRYVTAAWQCRLGSHGVRAQHATPTCCSACRCSSLFQLVVARRPIPEFWIAPRADRDLLRLGLRRRDVRRS